MGDWKCESRIEPGYSSSDSFLKKFYWIYKSKYPWQAIVKGNRKCEFGIYLISNLR